MVDIPSGGIPGPPLDDALETLDNNVYGSVADAPTPAELAEAFARSGWRARRSSRTEYEVGCSWTSLEFYQHNGATGFTGVLDPGRLDELVTAFADLGWSCSVELYDQERNLVASR